MKPEIVFGISLVIFAVIGIAVVIRHSRLSDAAAAHAEQREQQIRELAEELARVDEISEVQRLVKQSGLPSDGTTSAREKAFELILGNVSADDEITDQEAALIKRAEALLELTQEQVARITHLILLPKVGKLIQDAIADRRVSEEELDLIERASRNLRVKLDLQGDVDAFERYVAYAKWERGQLPVTNSSVSLQKGEVCHFAADCEFWESKTTRTRVGYSGMSYSLRIAKGVSYRSGTVAPRYSETIAHVRKDSGQLVVTSKRLIFVGAAGAKAHLWSSILEVRPYSDAVEVVKPTGKYPLYMLKEAEDVAVLASVLLNT